MFLRRGFTASSVNQKVVNRTLILNTILKFQPVSQVQLTKELSISKSTVSRIVAELVEEGMLRVVGTSKSRGYGRNPYLVALNPDYKRSIVIKIGVNYSMIAIADFSMSFGEVKLFKTKNKPEEFIRYVTRFVKQRLSIKPSFVSLSIPGIVDKDFKRIVIAPNLGWRELPLADMLYEKLHPILGKTLRISMDNEANLAVIAESILGKKVHEDDRNIVFVIFEEGVGTGLVINGQLYRGRWNTAGEFGHMVINMNGTKCHCGNRGCWEKYASITQVSKDELSISGLKFSKKDKEILKNISKDYAEKVATGIANIVNGLGPDVVIVGGTISTVWKHISEDVIKKVKKMSITPDAARVRIELTSFSDHPAELYGAAIWSFWDIFKGPVLI